MLGSRIGIRLGATIILVVSGVMAVSLFTTSPDQLGPYGITAWFIGLFAATSGLLATLFYWYKQLAKKGVEEAKLAGEALRQGILVSVWLTAVVALNSLRQLSLRDVVLITLLLLLVEFYMRRAR